MIRVSFILPCYNVAAYISRCLKSIENQDIPREEFEVICVDDCSEDNTVEIVELLQKQYSNILLFRHTENKTAGGARNTGISVARGRYLWFVDPDDEIEEGILSEVFEIADNNRLDVLLLGHKTFDEKGILMSTFRMPNSNQVFDGQSFIEHLFPGRLSDLCMMVNVLYRREYLLESGILFPCIKASQDVVFAWNALLHAPRAQSIDKNGYIVHKRPESTTGRVGRHKADKIFSRTVLFPFEVNQIRNTLHSVIIRNDLGRAIRWCVNDSLSSLAAANRTERKKYYCLIQSHKGLIRGLFLYMNRATRLLLTSSFPFGIWNLEFSILHLIKSA